MQHNLDEQLRWLTANLHDAQIAGFQYAPTASKNFEKPIKFNFDNQRRLNSRNAGLSSVGAFAHMELESFRKHEMRRSDEHLHDQLPGVLVSSSNEATVNRPVQLPLTNSTNNYSIPDSAFLEIDIDGMLTLYSTAYFAS